MTRIFRRLACGALLALALSLSPTPAVGSGLGLFGPRETVYLGSPVETVYAVPTVSSYIVPTTSVVSTSYLLPTSSVVYRPARYTLAPTIYRSAPAVLPTSYLVGTSVLRPTRYYVNDVVSTAFYPTSITYPTSVVYPSSIVYPSSYAYASSFVYDAPVVVDAPVVSAPPAGTSAARSQGEPALLDPPRQTGNSGGIGRSPSLENRALEPRPQQAPAESQRPSDGAGSGADPEPSSPPTLPAPDDTIEGIMPLPEPFVESRQSQRPAFSGGLPGTTLAAASKLVQGRVRDEQDGRPVGGLIVTFSNAATSLIGDRSAVTDSAGQFQLAEFLPDGDWSIVVSGAGENAPTRTYPRITVQGGRIFDRLGRDYSKLVLDY